MKEDFIEYTFREFDFNGRSGNSNLIKSNFTKINGFCKLSVEEESHGGVKVVLKKDAQDTIKEIKFICSCGHSKSVHLDYTE
jgi:hypothetical protein